MDEAVFQELCVYESILFPPQPKEARDYSSPHLLRRKLRHREVKGLAQVN